MKTLTAQQEKNDQARLNFLLRKHQSLGLTTEEWREALELIYQLDRLAKRAAEPLDPHPIPQ